MTLVFVPLSAEGLDVLAQTGALPGPREGFASTPAMRAAFGFGSADDEDSEFTTLAIAGVAAVLVHRRRLVAVVDGVELAEGNPELADFGSVTLPKLAWPTVISLFADEHPAASEGAHQTLHGAGLEAAWDHPAVEILLAQGDLLWHGPSEWGTLVDHALQRRRE